jgi:hypothetical protein
MNDPLQMLRDLTNPKHFFGAALGVILLTLVLN